MTTHSSAARPPALRSALALLAGGFLSVAAIAPLPAAARAGHGHHYPGMHGERHHAARNSAQSGVASIYARRFGGHKMADGGRFSPNSDSAASRTLPLGTIVLVTNLDTGRHCRVHVRDRGPYAGHRLLDLSPASASSLGADIRHPGLLHVVMQPISFPRLR